MDLAQIFSYYLLEITIKVRNKWLLPLKKVTCMNIGNKEYVKKEKYFLWSIKTVLYQMVKSDIYLFNQGEE